MLYYKCLRLVSRRRFGSLAQLVANRSVAVRVQQEP